MRVFPQPPESQKPQVSHMGKQCTQVQGVGSPWGLIAVGRTLKIQKELGSRGKSQ